MNSKNAIPGTSRAPSRFGPRGKALLQPSPRLFPAALPILDEQRTPDPAHRGHSPVHGEHGFDRDRHLAAGDRGGYWREPPDAETCHHLVSAVAGGIYFGERVGRRSFWRADGLLDREWGLCSGLLSRAAVRRVRTL